MSRHHKNSNKISLETSATESVSPKSTTSSQPIAPDMPDSPDSKAAPSVGVLGALANTLVISVKSGMSNSISNKLYQLGDAIEAMGDWFAAHVSEEVGSKIHEFGDDVEHSGDRKAS